MADRLTKIADTTPGLTMVLVGNFHAIVRDMTTSQGIIHPAASLLPPGKRVAVDVAGAGGSMWNCQMEGCHLYDYGPGPSGLAAIAPDASPDHRYDAIYTLGKPFTGAEPAEPGIADTKPLNAPSIKD
jgi:hypothetical protein